MQFMKYIKDVINFLKEVAKDERIPERDKKVLLVLIALVASPVDLIPDWIPIFGVMDDIVILAVIADYFFNHLDQDLLLSHWPWGMKSYTRVRRAARLMATLTPNSIRQRIWQFKPSVYEG
jgi:uncharacterized membrane protein YkvA (DUF1232 family)